jgi:hypothetical protein
VARVGRTPEGDYQLDLVPEERDLLRSLVAQLRELLGTDDPTLARLFPPAYDDPDRDAEYQRLMGDELMGRRLAHLDVLESTLDATRLQEEELVGWVSALNEIRLVLGTRLGVEQDPDDAGPAGEPGDPGSDDPEAAAFLLYGYLTWLQGEVVEALDT